MIRVLCLFVCFCTGAAWPLWGEVINQPVVNIFIDPVDDTQVDSRRFTAAAWSFWRTAAMAGAGFGCRTVWRDG